MDFVSNEDGRFYTRTVVYRGPRDLAVEEIDGPELEGSNDATLDITTTAICGSDLPMYE